MLARLLATDGDCALTVARIVLGVAFFVHGAQKFFGWFGGHGLDPMIKTFHDQMKIPAPLGYLAIFAEFFGGIGLIVGFLTRIAALGIAITMLVAMLKVHLRFGFLLNWFGDKPGHGIEYHRLAIALALILIAHGAGALSLDLALYRYIRSPEKIAFDLNCFAPFCSGATAGRAADYPLFQHHNKALQNSREDALLSFRPQGEIFLSSSISTA